MPTEKEILNDYWRATAGFFLTLNSETKTLRKQLNDLKKQNVATTKEGEQQISALRKKIWGLEVEANKALKEQELAVKALDIIKIPDWQNRPKEARFVRARIARAPRFIRFADAMESHLRLVAATRLRESAKKRAVKQWAKKEIEKPKPPSGQQKQRRR